MKLFYCTWAIVQVFITFIRVKTQSRSEQNIWIIRDPTLSRPNKEVLRCKVYYPKEPEKLKFYWKFTPHSNSKCNRRDGCEDRNSSEIQMHVGKQTHAKVSYSMQALKGLHDTHQTILTISTHDSTTNHSGEYTCIALAKNSNMTAHINITMKLVSANCSYGNSHNNLSGKVAAYNNCNENLVNFTESMLEFSEGQNLLNVTESMLEIAYDQNLLNVTESTLEISEDQSIQSETDLYFQNETELNFPTSLTADNDEEDLESTSEIVNTSIPLKGEIPILQIINQIYNNITTLTDVNASYSDLIEITNNTVNDFGNILINQQEWNLGGNDEKQIIFTKFIETLELTAVDLAEKFADKGNETNNIFFSIKNNVTQSDDVTVILGSAKTGQKVEIYADDKLIPRVNSIGVQIQTNEDYGQLENSTQIKFSYSVTMIEPKFFRNITNNSFRNITENGTTVEDNSKQLNGKLISFSFAGQDEIKDRNVTVYLEFVHNIECTEKTIHKFRRKRHPGEQRKAVLGSSTCVFWDTSNTIWSTKGCYAVYSNKYKTVCQCDHLTAFSVLMKFSEYSGKDRGLEILTWILSALSIIFLIFAIIILLFESKTRNDERKVTLHLCFALLLGNILLVAGDRNNFHISDKVCAAIGMATHFAWMCAFGWMAVEGLHLYHQVVKVFPSRSNHLVKVYSAVGYGIPLLIVAITFAVGFWREEDSIYVGVMYCWLREPYVLGFVGPVLLVILGNMGILTKVIFITTNKISNSGPKVHNGGKIKFSESEIKLIKGTISLTLLLGISWIFGVFTLVDFQGSMIFSYIFIITNASQGIFIFIFRCCLNNQTRQTINKMFSEAMSSFSKTSDYEGTISLEVHSRKKSSIRL